MRQVWLALFVAALFAAWAIPAGAQTQITSAVIQGTVLDPSSLYVPGAQVEAKNLETNFTRSATTDADGRFVFLQLLPGPYTITVTKQGFAKLVQENINLTVGQAVNLTLTLKVAPGTETVVVSATPTVDTVKVENSSTLNQNVVTHTPVLGRKFEDLLTLTPGVSVVQGPDGDEITFNGQRGIFTNISLDGGDYINGFFGEQVGGQRAAIDITLDAIKEFQVVATGANAEFGRTAAGVVNVVTKSGTNHTHGSVYHFQRHRRLSGNTSDGKPLTDFHREQFGATIGGPIVQNRAFYFGAVERITGNLQRDNLSAQVGSTACPVSAPVITNPANETLIRTNPDCSRLALINFIQTTRSQAEGLPVRRPLYTTAALGKVNWDMTPRNQVAVSYNFNASKKINETFDVATYGNSANGIEGNFTKIHAFNATLFTAISATKLNEAHYTYTREARPRSAVASNVAADTAIQTTINGQPGSFRFGAPFFLNPNINELFQRHQFKDNFSWVLGKHTVKFGGEYIHSNNNQIFRGFFTGRYIFDSVQGFLRYASPAALGVGFGPTTAECSDRISFGSIVLGPASCATGAFAPSNPFTFGPGPLFLYLQSAGLTGPATDATGASNINNDEYALFVQDKWQMLRNFTLSYGLRWEGQILPNPTTPPANTAYGIFLSNPAFPSNGTLPDQKKEFQPRVGFAWDIANNSKSVFRANYGIYYARQNMLSQVGSITTNGVQQQTLFLNTAIIGFGAPPPTWPGLVTPPAVVTPCVSGAVTNPFPCFTGVRVFDRNYANPRIYTANVAFEQELAQDWSAYVDYTHSKGVHLTRFLNHGRLGTFSPFLGDVFDAASRGKSLYDGVPFGMRKRFSKKYQLEWNYTVSRDRDDDSNERDPFTDRSFSLTNLQADYAYSDRDIRHKFNFFTYAELPWGFQGNVRMQARSAQPISPSPLTATNRNTLRKDNEFFSFDWRLQRPFKFRSDRYALVPIVEMFNTFNNKNNINPLSTPSFFNFDGFLRQGVGDPRQLQVAVRFTF